MAPDRFHHVANGSSTTGLIEAAGLAGTRSIWADVLYEGPVPGGLTDAQLLDVRERFLAGPAGVSTTVWRGRNVTLDPANDLHEWRTAIARHESYGELVLWFEHDLFDQLNLIQLLPWIREHLPPSKPVSLICIDSFPGRPGFKGLGELTPAELASLLDSRERVDEAQHALAGRAWQAFRQPAPEALDQLRRSDTSALPYLAAATTRFLQEYPWTIDGLSRSERRLLDLARHGRMALSTAFPQMHAGERDYYITDASLAELADSLSVTLPSLLTLDAGSRHENALQRTIALTDIGRAVLAGQLDRVATCGIDRWYGGAHLQGKNGIWRWDDTRQRMTRGFP